jgi:hypothetical protein
MTQLEMISVHVPKCAGTSFFRAIEAAYGAGSIRRDYDDRPLDPAAPMNLDPDGWLARSAEAAPGALRGFRVVHGHFHMHKYRGVKARLRVTFLRDPVERLVSHYAFWRNRPGAGHALHEYVLAQNLTLDAFARLPFLRTCFSEVFFRGVDLGELDFIGFHDRAGADMERLSALAGVRLVLPVTNPNPDPGYRQMVEALHADTARLGRLRDLLADDIAFYEKARALHAPA